MKVAAFNVENLFDRAKAFDQQEAQAQNIIGQTTELNQIFEKVSYSNTDKARILQIISLLGLERSDKGPMVILRKIRGAILKRRRNPRRVEVVANGRADWIGWVELRTGPVNEIAVQNTGRVIRDVAADILGVIEAEDRVSLKMFSEIILDAVGGTAYEEVMLIDGNDDRGIDVGVMTTNGYKIKGVTSHIYDLNASGRPIFSRDCPEYNIETPTGAVITVLVNHFKSKFGGNNAASRRRREDQATRTAGIYEELIANGQPNVIVLGDLNDTPNSAELAPLLQNTDLQDVTDHPNFDSGEFDGVGTYGLGNDSQKIDYLLLSPTLFDLVTSAGLFREGAWPGVQPPRWTVYPELTEKIHVASDHHVIWADINI